jgi:hypothetical protein
MTDQRFLCQIQSHPCLQPDAVLRIAGKACFYAMHCNKLVCVPAVLLSAGQPEHVMTKSLRIM